jgi:hypothetical protein
VQVFRPGTPRTPRRRRQQRSRATPGTSRCVDVATTITRGTRCRRDNARRVKPTTCDEPTTNRDCLGDTCYTCDTCPIRDDHPDDRAMRHVARERRVDERRKGDKDARFLCFQGMDDRARTRARCNHGSILETMFLFFFLLRRAGILPSFFSTSTASKTWSRITRCNNMKQHAISCQACHERAKMQCTIRTMTRNNTRYQHAKNDANEMCEREHAAFNML